MLKASNVSVSAAAGMSPEANAWSRIACLLFGFVMNSIFRSILVPVTLYEWYDTRFAVRYLSVLVLRWFIYNIHLSKSKPTNGLIIYSHVILLLSFSESIISNMECSCIGEFLCSLRAGALTIRRQLKS
ncbi:hypothetical protein Tcan_01067, partial [Toxocara canis]